MGRPIVTTGDFVAHLCESDALFPNYFGEDLFTVKVHRTDGFQAVRQGKILASVL